MEETIPEDLREKDFNAGPCQCRNVDVHGAQGFDLGDRRAVHAFHHHHGFGAPVPMYLGHEQQG
jgi:hypothetical protein